MLGVSSGVDVNLLLKAAGLPGSTKDMNLTEIEALIRKVYSVSDQVVEPNSGIGLNELNLQEAEALLGEIYQLFNR